MSEELVRLGNLSRKIDKIITIIPACNFIAVQALTDAQKQLPTVAKSSTLQSYIDAIEQKLREIAQCSAGIMYELTIVPQEDEDGDRNKE